jgi:hypothetical protein
MKFYKDFNVDVNKQAQKLIHTKNNLELYMDTYKTRQASADLPNAARAVDNLRPKTSVITHVQDNADFWMEQNLNIEPKQYDNNENTKFNDVENFNKTNRFNSKSFFPVVDLKYALKDQSKKLTLRSINLPKSVLEALVSSKGIIIREMKNFDKKNSGLISKFEVARAFVKANPHPSLTMNTYNDIIRIYANGKDLAGSTIYIAGYDREKECMVDAQPCESCMGAIKNAGIEHIVTETGEKATQLV